MFIIFDLLGKDRQSYVERSLKERRDMLEEFARENFETKSALRLSPATTNLTTAKKWFAKVGGNLDGVIAKELNASYACGFCSAFTTRMDCFITSDSRPLLKRAIAAP